MNKFIVGASVLGAAVVVGGIYWFGGMTHIGVGRLGMVKHMDGVVTEIGQGWHWTGWGVSVEQYPTYLQGTKYSMEVGTADSQKMPVSIAMNWQLNTKDTATLYQTVGGQSINYVQQNIVDQKVQTIVNQVTHQYTWNDLLGKQMPEATKQIQQQLTRALAADGIVLDSFGFTEVSSPNGMANAQQLVATAELGKEKAQAAQQQTIIENQTEIMKAQTDAKAAEIEATGIQAKAKAMNQYTIAEDAINKWNGALPSTNAGGAIPFLSVK